MHLIIYPQGGTLDWIGCFSTVEEAEAQVREEKGPPKIFQRGPRKGQPDPDSRRATHYYIKDKKYDHYEIVDLMTWMRK